MCGDSISTDDFGKMADTLSDVVARMHSLEEISTWLKSQNCIKSVQQGTSLIKTFPAQLEFVVEFKMSDGSTLKKAIDILLLESQKFRFRELHDF